MSNPTITEVKLQRVIDRQKFLIERLIEMVVSESETERAAWDMVTDLINGTNFPVENDFGSTPVQEAYEEYFKNFSREEEKQDEVENYAVKFLEAVCSNYISKQHGECIKIERSSEYQR